MLLDFGVGSLVSIIVMFCHLIATVFIKLVLTELKRHTNSEGMWFLAISLTIFYICAFITFCASVCIWAVTYFYLGFTKTFVESFYTAMVNYTTLGLGDLGEAIKTSIYGPMAAASGILMFSWTAALLVYVVQMQLPVILSVKENN